MTGEYAALVVSIIVALAYPLFMRFLANRVEPTRVKMDELGKRILAHPHVSDTWKDAVDEQLDRSYDWTVMIRIAVHVPILTLCRVCGLIRRKNLDLPTDPKARELLNEFFSCHMKSIAAANPLFTMVFALEIAIIAAVMVPLGMVSVLSERIIKLVLTAETRTLFNHS